MSPSEIRSLRARLGWTQEQLAAEVGVQRTTVTHWESGLREPSGSAKILLHYIAARPAANPELQKS